jgi:type VI secretion system protein ImpI/type VI secretion system protein
MTLVLSMLRWPDHATPETRRLTGGELAIGRDERTAQWVLRDPTVSRPHCLVRFDAGAWSVVDQSTNGTFLNRETAPIGKNASRPLKDGDRLRIGPYEIEARLEAEVAPDPAWPPVSPDWGGSLFPERASVAVGQFDPEAIALSSGFTPSEPSPYTPPPRPATTPDHSPSYTNAVVPLRPLLPDNWAEGLGLDDPPARPATALVSPIPPAPVPLPEPPGGAPPTVPLQPAVVPSFVPAAPPAGESGLLAAFMAGAGLPDVSPQDPLAAMRNAGAAFRAFVAGLREVLIVRAEVKDTLGIDKTSIRPRGNNPLKFSAGDDDALMALLGTGRRTEMTPQAAVAEALRDIRRHEQASLPAMQAAVRALLARLDPEKLRARAESGGGLTLPAQRRGRAWDLFEAEYGKLAGDLDDNFDAALGRRFAAEYARIVADLRQAEDKP